MLEFTDVRASYRKTLTRMFKETKNRNPEKGDRLLVLDDEGAELFSFDGKKWKLFTTNHAQPLFLTAL